MRAGETAIRVLGAVLFAFALFGFVGFFLEVAGIYRHVPVAAITWSAAMAGFLVGFRLAGRRRWVPLLVVTVVLMAIGYGVPYAFRTVSVSNDSNAMHDLRAILQAEETYRAITGAYGPPECLIETARCLEGYKWNNLLAPYMFELKQGYTRTFHPGPRDVARPERPPALRSFAVVAVPVVWSKTGKRNYCVDSSGGLFVFAGEHPPAAGPEAACTEPWARLYGPRQ
jgi:hypothetical protein